MGMKKTLYILFGLLVSLQGLAATRTWNGSSDTDWNNPSNWSGNSVPGSNDLAAIPSISNGNYPVLSTFTTIQNLEISDWSAGKLTISTGGSLTVTSNVDLNNYGELIIDGGAFIHTGNSFDFAYTSTKIEVLSGSFATDDHFVVNGEFHIETGTVSFIHDFTLSSGKSFYGGTGNITVNGNATINGDFFGEDATINFYKIGNGDKVNITSGGEVSLNTGTIVFHDAADVKSNGILTVNDGTVTFSKDVKFESSSVITVDDGSMTFLGDADFRSSASLTVTGIGSVNIAGTSTLQSSGFIDVGSGSLDIEGEVTVINTGSISATTGSLTLNGDLTLQNSNASINLGESTLNFNGGTLTNNGNFNADSSTVVLNSSADQTISGDIEFYNLEVKTEGEVTFNGNVIVTNDATIDSTSEVVVPGTHTLNVQGEFNDFSGTAVVNAVRPFIKYVTVLSATSIQLEFNKALEQTSAETSANYALSPGQTVQSAVLDGVNPYIVTLTITPGVANGTEYTLVMNNISNTTGKTISTNHTKRFDGEFTSAPTTPSSNAIITREPTSLTVQFTAGSGTNRIILLSTSGSFATLSDNTSYAIQSDFSVASPISGTTYAVYKGDLTSFTVTGLDQNTDYRFRIVEFDGSAGSEAYGATYDFTSHTDIYLELTVFLEGPYNSSSGQMNNQLYSSGLIPSNQPFNDSIWNYDGTESISSTPSTMVDWIFLELRSAGTAINATKDSIVFKQACILHVDGTVTTTDGSLIECDLPESGVYYLTIIHQTHLISLTNNQLAVNASGNYYWDYSASNSIYGGGLVEELGVYLIPTAKIESRNDVIANTQSLYDLIWQKRGKVEYSGYDVDRDGQVSASDRASLFNNKDMSKNVDND